ncbi:MAG TPA: enoyl-CoA hydratase/isomerase family protein [Acidimicrobiales bacterium]|jgi:enoyl-CoA hydratase/carnithine racemase|nr:enoyl-CoA hydratase/isomerase family protein [Acidimicrobiales bacterium]
MFDTIRVQADGPVGQLVLNRPDKLNPLSPYTLREIAAAARWFDADQPEVRVVVVRGEGRVFSAGADVSAFGQRDDQSSPHGDADAGRLMAEALESMSAIAIAQLHGWCVGGGLVLAAACDLRVAADDTRFSIPEVDLGIPLAWGGIPRLVREIGPAVTKELVITCREFGADEALRLGFLNRVVSAAALEATVDELAQTVASKPAFAAQSTKRHVNAVTASASQAGTAWSDADGLLAGLRDPEGRASAARYLEQVRRKR